MKNKYYKYIKEFQENNKYGIHFIDNHLIEGAKQTDVEHILDFVYSNKKIYKNLGYKTILEKANAWSKKLQDKASAKDNEVEGEDYEVIKKWTSGFRAVKLISKRCYEREGKLMSHCVGSYFSNGSEIISIRDKYNKPHATLSMDGGNIKGKGNGHISPKYIEYIVELLEQLEVKVRYSEMKNLGYVDISKITEVKFPSKYIFREKYYPKDMLDKVSGDVNHWSISNAFGIYDKVKLAFRFDIKVMMDNLKLDKHNGKASFEDNGNASFGYDGNASFGYNGNASFEDSGNASFGDNGKASFGNNGNASFGKYADVSLGKNCLCITGHESKVKAVLDGWIVLSESDEEGNIIMIKPIKIDGKKYKADTYYTLKNKKIVEVK